MPTRSRRTLEKSRSHFTTLLECPRLSGDCAPANVAGRVCLVGTPRAAGTSSLWGMLNTHRSHSTTLAGPRAADAFRN